MDHVLLWLIEEGRPISYPHLMMQHIRSISKTSTFIPYGTWLTLLFRDVYVPLGSGKSPSNLMTDVVLHKLDLYVLDGTLVKKGFLGFAPREACARCLQMKDKVEQMTCLLHRLNAKERACDVVQA